MKFFHLSDIHIGKRFFEKSLDEDFRYVFEQIYSAAREERPDAILISGDVYDSTSPSAEAVSLFDDFLTELSGTGAEIFIISGNHDSADRLAFGRNIFSKNRIHISDVFNGRPERFVMGDTAIHMLPFVRPSFVRKFVEEGRIIDTHQDAVRFALEGADLSSKFNIIMSHQFVVSSGNLPQQSESETYVGSLENVDSSLYNDFDYVALGHIHSPQYVGSRKMRYCGSLLKLSFSECERDKTITVVEIGDSVDVREIPLKPLRDLRVIRGPLEGLIEAGKAEGRSEDYIFAHLTDTSASDAMARLREVYPNIMGLDFLRSDESVQRTILSSGGRKMSAEEEFGMLFEKMTGKEMTDEQKKIVSELLEQEGVVL